MQRLFSGQNTHLGGLIVETAEGKAFLVEVQDTHWVVTRIDVSPMEELDRQTLFSSYFNDHSNGQMIHLYAGAILVLNSAHNVCPI